MLISDLNRAKASGYLWASGERLSHYAADTLVRVVNCTWNGNKFNLTSNESWENIQIREHFEYCAEGSERTGK